MTRFHLIALFAPLMASFANAQAAGAPPAGSQFMQIGMIVVLFAVFYFLIIRPQRKRQKEMMSMLDALQVGDEVTTNGGILGKVKKISEAYVVLKVGEGMELKFQKNAILAVLPKGTLKEVDKGE
ncbi:MAG: preprotein translocase subunit YajC [Cellvibrionales bacterium]|nr:preprotein translocase subunit YajC [Cellvibrionales bacterium]